VEPRPVGSRRSGDRVRRVSQDWPLIRKENGLSEQRRYRTFTVQQKLEIVLAGLRGDVAVKELCRTHEIAETLYYSWREKLLEGGRVALSGKAERVRCANSVLPANRTFRHVRPSLCTPRGQALLGGPFGRSPLRCALARCVDKDRASALELSLPVACRREAEVGGEIRASRSAWLSRSSSSWASG